MFLSVWVHIAQDRNKRPLETQKNCLFMYINPGKYFWSIWNYLLNDVTSNSFLPASCKIKILSDQHIFNHAHLHPLINILTKYQHPTPYSF